ncbi:MAG TPA: M10 family metallopeptidase [Dongiaceae bacterium]|nr:M10 family metallopeptidase [Dongiaceae bacterium]
MTARPARQLGGRLTMTSPYETGVVETFKDSSDPTVSPLVWLGYKWGSGGGEGTSATITYSFPTAHATWSDDYKNFLDNEPFNAFEPFTAGQKTAARQALSLWAEVAQVSFIEVSDTPGDLDVGDIRFGNSGAVTNSPSAAWAYTPFDDGAIEYPENGDVWFDKKYAPNLRLQPGQEGFATMLHEIGHALGLDHPFDDGEPGEPILAAPLDTDQYTVMSYTPELSTLAYASTPQMLDILAIQYIYGANMTTRTGNDTYKFSAAEVNRTIWDAGGNDTLDFSNQSGAAVTGVLQEGTFFRFGGHPSFGTTSILGIAYGVTIENVIGSNRGNNITGNDVANRMIGGNAADFLAGLGGDDHLEGRGGNDTLQGGAGGNFVDGGAGNDIVTGGEGIDTLLGGAGNDQLTAFESDDFLDGGLGIDTMLGGSGNDTYVISAAGDVINEEGNLDNDDVVRSSIAVNLTTLGGGQIENAILLGTAALKATGNGTDNELTGNNGANILDGGIGADILTGGKGADTYFVNEAGDQVIESIAGTTGGIDTVKSSIDFSLAALVNVEKLTLLAGFSDLDATGNALNNTLTGNEFKNVLNGGVGKDTMLGGGGDDYYFVDNIGDIVTETILNTKGGGIDTVESTVTYSLAAHANVDHLILTGGANINGTGNALNNEITGNSGANTLNGGTGNDVMAGGNGNDALNGGSGNDTLDGGNDNDTLIGGAGNDLLTGDDGNDKMTGGTGNDVFDFNLKSELGDVDTITDFKKGADLLDISDLLDDALYAGSDIFADQIVSFTYNGTTTNVLFDADGAGGSSATALASLLNVHLTNLDGASFIV